MPQKRNPDMLELIRGRCGSLYGNLMAFLTMLKGQPLAYNRDMQEDKKQLFDAADTLEGCLQIIEAIVRHTTFVEESVGRDLDGGFLDATSLAEYLVGKGIPFRQAHQVVGSLVARCEERGNGLAQLSLEELQKACEKIEPDVYECLTAAKVVGSYATAGSAGRASLEEQLAFWKKQLQ